MVLNPTEKVATVVGSAPADAGASQSSKALRRAFDWGFKDNLSREHGT
jgi:hypothetical protein